MDAAALNGSLAASCKPPSALGQPMSGVRHSRGALAAAIAAHVIGALVFVKLLEVARIPLPRPIVVELLQPEPEIRKEEPPKKKPPPPELKKEEPPPPPEIKPEIKPEILPEPPPEIRPDILPEPLPQVEMPQPPVVLPIPQVRREIVPEQVRPRVEPVPVQAPVVRRPVEPVRAPPPPAVAPRDPVREQPAPPPILTARAPTPVATVVEPRRPDLPIAAPQAPLAPPREPPRRAVPVAAPSVEVAEAPLPVTEAEVAEPAPAPLPIGPVPEGPEILDADMLTALYLRNPKPGYPAASRRLGEQGTVFIRVFVVVSGEARRVELKTSSGFPRLDRAALDSVQTWKFVPARRDDKPIDAWVVVPIKFALKK